MKPLILLDAAPFCFGPVSTLQAVVDHILEDAFELVMLVSGTSAEFMREYDPRCKLVPCDTENVQDLERVKDLFERCSVFICNTNPVSARFAVSISCRVVYLDTLFWMWDEIDHAVARSAIYVAQEFRGVEENRRRIGHIIRDFRVVQPLLADPGLARNATRQNTLIVSFGGIESKLTVAGTTNRYPWVMTKLLLELFGKIQHFDSYLFRGGARIVDLLAKEFKDSRCDFAFTPHHTFLSELRQSRQCLLSPGLTGAYEAMQVATPSCLLLPQNYSQQLQAETFLSSDEWPFEGWHWHDVYDWVDLPRYLPEPDAIARLNEVIRHFETDGAAQRRYFDFLQSILPMSPRVSADSPQSGAKGVAEMIRSLVAAS